MFANAKKVVQVVNLYHLVDVRHAVLRTVAHKTVDEVLPRMDSPTAHDEREVQER